MNLSRPPPRRPPRSGRPKSEPRILGVLFTKWAGKAGKTHEPLAKSFPLVATWRQLPPGWLSGVFPGAPDDGPDSGSAVPAGFSSNWRRKKIRAFREWICPIRGPDDIPIRPLKPQHAPRGMRGRHNPWLNTERKSSSSKHVARFFAGQSPETVNGLAAVGIGSPFWPIHFQPHLHSRFVEVQKG